MIYSFLYFVERLLQLRISIFDDVIQDFSSLDKIKARFEEWRFGFFDSYKEAYIHLCLPKLLSPFLRLEMLDWNPFQVGVTGLCSFLASCYC